MKIAGKKIEGPNVELIIIPRGESQIVFKAQAVLDFSDFDKLCPAPVAKVKMFPGGKTIQDVESPEYKKELTKYSEKRIAWLYLQSLKSTEGLEWETIDMSNSDTWNNFDSELKSAGFSAIEIMRITSGIMSANSLNETKIEEARNRFLAGQVPVPSE